MMYRFTALITGASGGIGCALCQEFARGGYNLVISGRKREKLDAIAARLRRDWGVAVTVVPADLAAEDGAARLLEQLKALDLQIDVLVNNAGFGQAGYFVREEPAALREMQRVNMQAPTELCRALLPEMIARGGGKVLNLASTGSFVAGPMNAVYCASKAYILSLSEALARETRGTGVSVTAVCPGATHTGFADRADMESSLLFNVGVLDARRVARDAYAALMRGKPVEVVGLQNKLMVAACKLSPRWLAAAVSGAVQRPGRVRVRHPDRRGRPPVRRRAQ